MSTVLTTKQKARRLLMAARRGESVKSYVEGQGWDYKATRYELVQAGLWNQIMAAKYGAVSESI